MCVDGVNACSDGVGFSKADGIVGIEQTANGCLRDAANGASECGIWRRIAGQDGIGHGTCHGLQSCCITTQSCRGSLHDREDHLLGFEHEFGLGCIASACHFSKWVVALEVNGQAQTFGNVSSQLGSVVALFHGQGDQGGQGGYVGEVFRGDQVAAEFFACEGVNRVLSFSIGINPIEFCNELAQTICIEFVIGNKDVVDEFAINVGEREVFGSMRITVCISPCIIPNAIIVGIVEHASIGHITINDLDICEGLTFVFTLNDEGGNLASGCRCSAVGDFVVNDEFDELVFVEPLQADVRWIDVE